jgi:hypothetical protein
MSAHCVSTPCHEDQARSLKPIRTLLRNVHTGEYFKGLSNWTHQVDEAFNFHAIERALRFVRDAGLKKDEFELIFAFEDPQFNIPVPIDERFEQPAMR